MNYEPLISIAIILSIAFSASILLGFFPHDAIEKKPRQEEIQKTKIAKKRTSKKITKKTFKKISKKKKKKKS